MTRTGERIIHFIKEYQAEHSHPPTVREIQTGIGMKSASTIHRWLIIYRSQGVLDWVDGQARTLTLTKAARIDTTPFVTESEPSFVIEVD